MMFNKIEDDKHTYPIETCVNGVVDYNTKKPIDPSKMEACRKISAQEKDNELQFLINNTPCLSVLELKKGATIMCTANIDLANGICNGSQGVIVDFVNNIPKVKFYNGITMCMEKHIWASETYPSIYISQYPLILVGQLPFIKYKEVLCLWRNGYWEEYIYLWTNICCFISYSKFRRFIFVGI